MRLPLIAAALLALATAGCEAPRRGAGPDADAAGGPEAGRRLYRAHCAACHGASGRGDGPRAAGLARPPADLTRLAPPGAPFPHARVMSHIHGHFRRGSDGTAMPLFGDVLDGPLRRYDSGDGIATATPVPLIAVSEYLAGLQRETPPW